MAKSYLSAPRCPAAVEWTNADGLYATTNALVGVEEGQSPKGKVVQITG